MFRNKRFDETPPPCTDESAFSGDISKKVRVPAYSHDQWYNYSSVMDTEVPLVPSNVFNWFAIRGEFSDGTHESNKYMLIDDIKAELKPYCNHPCAPNKMEPILAHWTEEINGVYTEVLDPDLSLGTRSRSFPLEPVLLNLKNANFVRLTVKNRWGEEVIHEWFDPRGLSNAHWNQADFQVFSAGTKAFIQNRPDLFSVVWNGGFSGGRMQGVVTLKIEASNCSNGSHKVVYKDLTLFGQDVHPQPKYNTQKYFYRGCCTPGSKTHSSQLLKSSDKYEDFISYENGTSCTLAGGYIGEAGNFLEVLPGVEFSASALEPASSVNLQINSYCQPLATEEPLGKQLGSIDLESKKHLSIYPNPGKNQVTIRGISRLYYIRSVQGFPLDLGLVEIYESGKNELSLDVSNLPEGVFFLEAESTDGTIETLKLLIRK